jgi:hypothetical protein
MCFPLIVAVLSGVFTISQSGATDKLPKAAPAKPVVPAATSNNWILNPGFETGNGSGFAEDWTNSTIAFGAYKREVSTNEPQSGSNHLILAVTADDDGTTADGEFTGGPNTGAARSSVEQVVEIPSTSGTACTFSFGYSNPENHKPGVIARYDLTFFDAGGAVLESPGLKSYGAAKVTGGYETFTITVPLPSDAVQAKVFFDIEGGVVDNPEGVESAVYLDDIYLGPPAGP